MLELVIKVLGFAGAGLLLLGLNLWFVLAIRNAFFEPEPPKSIAPFQVVGKTEEEKLGAILAHLLQARFAQMRAELQASRQAFREGREVLARRGSGGPEGPVMVQDAGLYADLQALLGGVPLPDKLFERFDLSLSLGGVDVGGFVASAQRLLFKGRILRVSIHYEGGRAKVAGDDGLSLDLPDDGVAIVSAIAYTVLQREVAKRFPEVEALGPEGFRDFIAVLHRLADLYRADVDGLITGRRPPPESYAELLPGIAALVAKAPRWLPLVRLAAAVAEQSRDLEATRGYYRMVLLQVPPEEPGHAVLAARLGELEERIAGRQKVAAALATAPTLPPAPDKTATLRALRATPLAGRLLKSLGVEAVPMRGAPRIAILGGAPSAPFLDWDGVELVGGRTGEGWGREITDYVNTLMQSILLLAPQARLLFAAPGEGPPGQPYFSDPELLRSLDLLLRARPDILLVPVGPLRSPLYAEPLRRAVRRDILVVLAAGTRDAEGSGRFVQPPLVPNAMRVSAVGPDGRPAPFSPTGDDLFWAPGLDIPVYNPRTEAVEPRSGTGYAAAIAAGLAARLLDEHPLELQGLLETLRGSAIPLAGKEGPPVLNLAAALKAAEQTAAAGLLTLRREAAVDLPIPDNDPAGIRSSITVDQPGTIREVKVRVDITHTYIGDLRVVLVSPWGDAIVLHDRQGGSADEVITTYTPALVPVLSALIGRPMAGEWTLQVADLSALDTGRLNRWSLEFAYQD